MTHARAAETLFLKGYNCAQSTAAPFAADFGLDEAFVLQALAGFGGGIGGLRETCGAVSAMAFIAGLHAGGYPPDDLSAKKALYDLVKRMTREFRKQHGTLNCRELLEQAGCVAAPDPSERSAAYYAARPCARLIASAADIIERVLVVPRG
jgi:C_GCAxxG_C_C family probable redox protein